MKRLVDSLFLVGGDGFTQDGDALCYALDLGALVLIDCGLGPGWGLIRDRMARAGLEPDHVHTLILTHCHADHAGGAGAVWQDTGCRIVAHALDREALETGDPERTAASWYGRDFDPIEVGEAMVGDELILDFPRGALRCLHTPGHTPGSVAVLWEGPEGRVLFGQDIHGPFHPSFGSDVAAWRRSMDKLLALECDILCEGHHGVIRGRQQVRAFIEGYLARVGHAG